MWVNIYVCIESSELVDTTLTVRFVRHCWMPLANGRVRTQRLRRYAFLDSIFGCAP